MATNTRIALVTGANKGLGLETSRQLARLGHTVVMAGRNEAAIKSAAAALSKEGLLVDPQVLDVSEGRSIERTVEYVKSKYGRLDMLVNNAGILPDPGWGGTPGDPSVFAAHVETIREGLETNAFGPMRLMRSFAPMMKAAGYGRIVNVSSGMGQLSDMNGGYPAYRLSKVVLNALTRIFSEELKGTNVLVNCCCPGWVKTDMGTQAAPRGVEEGAAGIVGLATLPDGGPTGGFFRDMKPIPW